MTGGYPVRIVEGTYSPDVELDDQGRVVFARHIEPGTPIEIPRHLLERLPRTVITVPGERP